MCGLMSDLNIAVDGGKDSLSMAAKVKRKNKGESEVVKSPGTLVISTYAPVPDVRFKVTPVMDGTGDLVYIDLSGTKRPRTGGSAFAQVYNQIGDNSPDIDRPEMLRKCFPIIQDAIRCREILAGHDVSDGGLIVCVIEMAIATNCGLDLKFTIPDGENILNFMFAEECGIVIEVGREHTSSVIERLNDAGLVTKKIGKPMLSSDQIVISINGGAQTMNVRFE